MLTEMISLNLTFVLLNYVTFKKCIHEGGHLFRVKNKTNLTGS